MSGTTGLVLGKFAPLHRGHQLLMDEATRATDKQVFVVYDSPSVTAVPLTVRANWIRALYPRARVIEAWGASEEVGLSPEIQKVQEDFLVKLLAGQSITHFFSSEEYGEHISRRLGCEDVRVDEGRHIFPVSGSAIRSDPFAHREYVHSLVYQDLVRKVVFLGAPSTGKSTIAELAAKAMNTEFMPEYGREYWERHANDRRLTMTQLEEIATTHIQREVALAQSSRDVLFVDTDASTTAVFADYYHQRRSDRLENLAATASSRYDVTFLCANDFPYADTEDRSGEANQIEFQRRIEEDLLRFRRPFVRLSGTIEERLAFVIAFLGKTTKYSNPGEWPIHD